MGGNNGQQIMAFRGIGRALRHAGEIKSYIDLLFLALVILLCVAKIVTN